MTFIRNKGIKELKPFRDGKKCNSFLRKFIDIHNNDEYSSEDGRPDIYA